MTRLEKATQVLAAHHANNVQLLLEVIKPLLSPLSPQKSTALQPAPIAAANVGISILTTIRGLGVMTGVFGTIATREYLVALSP